MVGLSLFESYLLKVSFTRVFRLNWNAFVARAYLCKLHLLLAITGCFKPLLRALAFHVTFAIKNKHDSHLHSFLKQKILVTLKD
jgi:hypothetical protein